MTENATAWLVQRLKAARSDSEAHPKGHSNRAFYAGQAIAYENVLSLLEGEKPGALRTDSDEGTAREDGGLNDAISEIVRRAEKDQAFLRRTLARMREDATPAPTTPPGVPDSVRALRQSCQDAWERPEIFAERRRAYQDALVEWVETLLSAHPAGQSEPPRSPFLGGHPHDRFSVGARPQGVACASAGHGDDNAESCWICDRPLIAGQRVMQDIELGTVHADCCGPEREAYVKDVGTGEPLGPNDPIPQGYIYQPDGPAGQSAGLGAEEIERRLKKADTAIAEMIAVVTAEKGSEIADAWPMAIRDQIDTWQDSLQAALDYLRGIPVQPAPDSTRTGPVGAGAVEAAASVREVLRKAVSKALHDNQFFDDWPEMVDPVVDAVLAARPAAPEAQGAWRPIKTAPKDGTEFAAYENGDVYKCHWKEYDDGEGRWSEGWFDHVNESLENPTHWCSLDRLPAPPSSGQGGR